MKYRWARTWPDDRDWQGKPVEDYVAFDSELNIGRIYLDQQTLRKNQWRWAGGYPIGYRSVIMPNCGWLPTAALAAGQIEDYWDRMVTNLRTSDKSTLSGVLCFGQVVRISRRSLWCTAQIHGSSCAFTMAKATSTFDRLYSDLRIILQQATIDDIEGPVPWLHTTHLKDMIILDI